MMPHSRTYRTWTLVCAGCLFSGGVHSTAQTALPQTPGNRIVTLVYTADGNSVLTNCGCSPENLGGIERRATLFRELRTVKENPVFFDSGDFLSMSSIYERDSLTVGILAMLNYDALALGDQEFVNGRDFIETVIKPARLPLVTTNLMMDGKPVGAVSRIIQRGGFRIGVVSAIRSDTFYFIEEMRERYWEATDPAAAIAGQVASFKGRTDLIVCLSHLGLPGDRALAAVCPELDVILGAHSKHFLEEPERVGRTLIVQPGSYGEFVGILDLHVAPDGAIAKATNRLAPLNEDIPPDAAVMAVINEFQEAQRKARMNLDVFVSTIPPQYLIAPSAQCEPCHTPQWNQWQETRHAHAIEALAAEQDRRNPECLSCHTTGFGRSDGYTREFADQALAMVGCVDCHFTPTEHVLKPAQGQIEPITEQTCTRCHNLMNSPEFNYQHYLLKITH